VRPGAGSSAACHSLSRLTLLYARPARRHFSHPCVGRAVGSTHSHTFPSRGCGPMRCLS
jgi:hypothetical protein